jgi:hypothetical protein
MLKSDHLSGKIVTRLPNDYTIPRKCCIPRRESPGFVIEVAICRRSTTGLKPRSEEGLDIP